MSSVAHNLVGLTAASLKKLRYHPPSLPAQASTGPTVGPFLGNRDPGWSGWQEKVRSPAACLIPPPITDSTHCTRTYTFSVPAGNWSLGARPRAGRAHRRTSWRRPGPRPPGALLCVRAEAAERSRPRQAPSCWEVEQQCPGQGTARGTRHPQPPLLNDLGEAES